jgi:hypothetical protein
LKKLKTTSVKKKSTKYMFIELEEPQADEIGDDDELSI